MSEVVIALYRPRADRDEAFRALLRRHVTMLREEGLATKRPVLLLRSREDGTYLELFEWVSAEAARTAHERPAVARIWKEMEEIAEFRPLGSLPEAGRHFPHFEAVDGVTS